MYTRLPEATMYHAGASCYLCHRVEDVVDTGLSIEGEGVLAICTNCIKELAVEGGMDPDAEGEIETMVALTTTLTGERDRDHKLVLKLRKQLREERALREPAPSDPSE